MGPLMLILSPSLMLIPTSCTEDTMDLDTMVLDMDTTDIPMLTMARDLLMPNLRLMLTPTSSMLDIMDSDMHITDTLMLTMARGLLMLSLRLMLILIFSMVDTMDLDTMVLAMAIPMVAM